MASINKIKIFAVCLTAICSLVTTGCSASSKTLDTVSDEVSIEEAAETLGVSAEKFEKYLSNSDMTWDEMRAQLNAASMTVAQLKEQTEANFDAELEGATFANYVDFMLFEMDEENTSDPSDEYTFIDSPYGSYDVYFKSDDLEGMTFKSIENSEIVTDATSAYVQLFTAFEQYGTNIEILSAVTSSILDEGENYAFSIEVQPVIILQTGSGKKLPEDLKDNPFLRDGYVYNIDGEDLYEPSVCAVLTVHYHDPDNITLDNRDEDLAVKDFTVLCSSEFGFVVKADNYMELTKIIDIDIQSRYNQEKAKGGLTIEDGAENTINEGEDISSDESTDDSSDSTK